MKKILYCFMGFLLVACSENLEHQNRVHLDIAEDESFILIRDGLYEDEEGLLYHRALDVSAIDHTQYRYNQYLRVDTMINGEETFHTPLISDFIDKETFRLVSIDSTGPGLEVEHYADKNGKYFLLVVADGGVLHKSK